LLVHPALLRQNLFAAISRWQPIASIVTIAPLSSKASSNAGIAVISLLLSAVLTWPKVAPNAPQ